MSDEYASGLADEFDNYARIGNAARCREVLAELKRVDPSAAKRIESAHAPKPRTRKATPTAPRETRDASKGV